MRRRLTPLIVMIIPLVLTAGCGKARDRRPEHASSPRATETATASTGASGAPAESAAPATGTAGAPAGAGAPPGSGGTNAPARPPQGAYQTTYGWGVPSNEARVPHAVSPLPPPSPPLPYLVAIGAGEQSENGRTFSRISFSFRGAFPEYTLQYVREVLSEGEGQSVSLEGNAFLRIRFVHAQSHGDGARSTITSAADRHIGHPTLRSYAPAGDFEGYVTYGLGIQTAPNSDQAVPIRVGELRQSDAGGPLYVVAFDVSR